MEETEQSNNKLKNVLDKTENINIDASKKEASQKKAILDKKWYEKNMPWAYQNI